MLKLFDSSKRPLGYLTEYRDLCVESDLSNGDKSLSFVLLQRMPGNVQNECYIETQEERYVIKESGSSSDGFPEFKCQLDLEDLEEAMFEQFTAKDKTLTEAANLALAGTGWRVSTAITKKRSVQTFKATPLTVIGKIRDAWMCEVWYDTKNKTVFFAEKFGSDKGIYFIRGLNLKSLDLTVDSYDYYTRIIPLGKDGLKITGVNGGKEYLENHQYSSKIRTLIWEDTSYEDAKELLSDAEKKLEDLSRPKKSYSADIRDLAKYSGQYSVMEFALGDTITLIDEVTGIRDKQRIVKMTEYPDEPLRNSCELSNTVLTFEQQQEKLDAAAAAWENVSNADGTIKGVYVHGVEADGIVGIETTIGKSETVKKLQSDVAGNTESIGQAVQALSAVKAKVGTLEATMLKVTDADLKYATIQNLTATNENVHNLLSDYADFKTVTAKEIAAHQAVIDQLSATYAKVEDLNATNAAIENLSASYATIDLANVKAGSITTAMIGTGAVQTAQIADGSITNLKVAADLDAGKITAGTLSVERLIIRGSAKSIVYQLNNISGALQAQQVDTLNGEILTPRTITADRIVANSITGNEIAAKTITANNIAANTITGAKIAASTIKAGNIDVSDLFAQNITATGTITGLKLSAATGSFSGSITASSGKIGGYTITSTANTDTTAKGGHCYTVSLYGHSGDGTYEYEIGLKSDASATSGSGNLAFYVKRIAKDAQWSTAMNLFYVTHAGKLYAQNAEITGTITTSKLTATGGTIGGFEINASKLICTATINDVAYTAWLEKNTGATTNYFWGVQVGGASKAYVRYDGYLYANNANITGSITATSLTAKNTYYIHNASGTKKVAMTAPDASFGSSLDIGAGFTAVHISGQVITGGNLTVLEDGTGSISCGAINSNGTIKTTASGSPLRVETTGANNAYFYSKNGNRGGYYGVSSGNNLGIYDATNSSWVIMSSTSQVVSIPHNTSITGTLTTSGNANLATVATYSGNYKPVGSYGTNGRRIAYMASRGSGSSYKVNFKGQFSDDGSVTDYSSKGVAVSSSDIRLKKNIRDTDVLALDVIEKIKIRQFDWRDSGIHQRIGVVADELQELDEKMAIGGGYDEDGEMDIKIVDNLYVIGYALKAIQELSAQNKKLQRELYEMKKAG